MQHFIIYSQAELSLIIGTKSIENKSCYKNSSKNRRILFVVSNKAVILHAVNERQTAAIAQLVEQRIRNA